MKALFIIIYITFIISSCSYMISNKNFFRHTTLLRLTEDETASLVKCKEDILIYKSSWNPLDRFKVPGIEEKIHQLEQKKESEKKTIFICKLGEYEFEKPPKRKINRKKFDEITKDRPLRLVGDFGVLTPVDDFEELIDEEIYVLYDPSEQNFESFARSEGDVQTKDTVNAILNKSLMIPGFDSTNCKVLYEYDIKDPSVQNPAKSLGFGFPIRPDAVLISEDGNTWLVIESKHSGTKALVNLFIKKMQFIIANKDKPFLLNIQRGVQRNPKYIISAMSSITDYEQGANQIIDTSNQLIRLCRDGLNYILV